MAILKEDDLIDQGVRRTLLRKLITYMMEDARTISPSLDLLFRPRPLSALAITPKNIAGTDHFLVRVMDVRHTSLGDIESACCKRSARHHEKNYPES